MKAYKFLREGGVSPFTATCWPLPKEGKPGEWVEAHGVEMCRRGVHACTIEDLPYWFQDELWEVELAGDMQRVGHKVAAARGRLVRRVDGWNPDCARAFSFDCADRAAAIAAGTPEAAAHAADAVRAAEAGNAAVSGFIVARSAELSGGVRAYDAERATQVEWLVRRLELTATSD